MEVTDDYMMWLVGLYVCWTGAAVSVVYAVLVSQGVKWGLLFAMAFVFAVQGTLSYYYLRQSTPPETPLLEGETDA